MIACLKKVVFLAGILSPLFAATAGAFTVPTDRGLGMGGTVLLSKTSASTLVSIPIGGIENRTLKIDLFAERFFNVPALDQGGVAMAYRYGVVTGVIGMSQLGFSGLFAERTIRAGAGWRFAAFALGGTVSLRSLTFDDQYDGVTAATASGCVSYRTRRLLGAISVENISEPKFSDASASFERVYHAYLEVIGIGSFSLTGRATVEKYQKPQFALGQLFEVSRFGALFWGVSSEPLQYGGGVDLIWRQSRVTYAGSYHPTLGFSHQLSLSLSIGFTAPANGGNP
jgi:hypothetical protein